MPYTDTQKREAVTLYVEVGTAEAARRVGVTTRTITNWAKAAGVTSAERTKKVEHATQGRDTANAERRAYLRDLFLENAIAGAEAADPSDAKSFQLLSVGCGTFLDKFRLEMGEATGRTESVDLAAAESRVGQEIIRLSELHANDHA